MHYTLALEVPLAGLTLPEGPSRFGNRLQIYARLSDHQGRIVKQFDIERSLAPSSSPRTPVQRMVWTGQVHLRSGRYLLDTVAHDPETGRASVRRVSFEATDPTPGLSISSVALLHPMDSLTVRDQGRETDDPFLLAGEPLMPTLELRTSAAPGVKVEFFTIVYTDPTSPEPVNLTLELVRQGSVVATVPLALPPADDRGEIRYAGGMATRTLAPADYRLRLVARQGSAQTSEETAFAVRADSDVAPVRVGDAPPPSAAPSSLPALAELAEARALLVRQDYDQAIRVLKKADKATSGARADVALLLAVAYYRAGAHKDAAPAAQRAVELARGTPAVIDAYVVLGRALAAGEAKAIQPDSEKLRAAEEAFRHSLTDTQNEAGQLALAEILFRLDRGPEARKLLTALMSQPNVSAESATRAQLLLQSPRCVTEACLPPLSFVTADGRHGTSEDLRGKAVLLSFWATWCKPCVEAAPELRRLYAKYEKEPFVLLGINLDSDPSLAQSFARENSLSWPQVIDGGSTALGAAAAAQGIPLELLFDHEGVLVGRSKGWGPDTSRALFARVQEAVGKAKKVRDKAQVSGQ
jgi:thiol-disulfide isomerase/thioredoxin